MAAQHVREAEPRVSVSTVACGAPGRGPDDNVANAAHIVNGLVIRSESGFYAVLLDDGRTLTCRLRGRLTKVRTDAASLVTIGDRVEVTENVGGEGNVEEVLPRTSELARRSAGPGRNKWLRQTLAANLTLVVVVASIADPEFNAARLDRFLVVVADAEIPVAICMNKIDLASPEAVTQALADYCATGYPQIRASVRTNEGIDELKALLHGNISALIGASGTGKSSLLNALISGSRQRTGEVSAWGGKGRHTTSVAQLLRLDESSWVADTPGLRELAPWQLQRDRLPWLFPEIKALLAVPCRFSACSHLHEPGCRVIDAVEAGAIPQARYNSYVKLWEEAT